MVEPANWQSEVNSYLNAGESSVILLYGNVRDYFEHNGEFLKLNDYLFKSLLADRQYRFFYDPQGGIQFPAAKDREEFFSSLRGYDAYHKTSYAENPPKQPGPAFSLIENIAKLKVMDNVSTGVIINYLEHITPHRGNRLSSELRYLLIAIDKWAQNSLFLENNITFFLLTENLALVDDMITRNPFIPRVYIPHPAEENRRHFIGQMKAKYKVETELSDEAAAKVTSGLSLLQISRAFAHVAAENEKLSMGSLKSLKKKYIEAECYGLLEFVEPEFNLDYVAGHTVAKEMLRNASAAFKEGLTSYLPMGYLIAGPVGTGKTFLVNCFAGEVGIPVVKFLNFRSQWVGSTEANLEKIINVLKAANPVVVMIDEADAFLGDRNQQGDSGTSSRVFASLISFMGDTSYRGKILWFLMTSRPDLLPIDSKRQGRAEEHIALFHPQSEDEREELFRALAKKNRIESEGLSFTAASENETVYSGADIEAILVRAAMTSQLRHEPALSQNTLNETVKNFLSPNYPLEMELQILVAIRECTNRRLIPAEYREKNYDDISARINELLMLLRQM